MPYVDKLLYWVLQIQVLAQDEGEVLQTQKNQEIQVICYLPRFVCFKVIEEQRYWVYISVYNVDNWQQDKTMV